MTGSRFLDGLVGAGGGFGEGLGVGSGGRAK